jgi:hypothetical protein
VTELEERTLVVAAELVVEDWGTLDGNPSLWLVVVSEMVDVFGGLAIVSGAVTIGSSGSKLIRANENHDWGTKGHGILTCKRRNQTK